LAGRLRPYWLQAYLLVFTFVGLFADSRVTAVWQQYVLGGISFVALYLAALKAPRELRLQVWVCVLVATGYEVFGSLVWGIYRYRFHNLPLYVPAGHGIVYLFGLLAASTPLVQRQGRRVAYAVLGAAAVWATAGLTVLPLITGRMDVQGALWLPYLAWFLLRSPRWPVFAAIFIIVGELEICGTSFGNWTWAASAPWTHLPSGNPPSVVAGGYCVIDASVLSVLWLLRRYEPGLNTIITRINRTMTRVALPTTWALRSSVENAAEEVSPATASLT
jgi:hypothetical protein